MDALARAQRLRAGVAWNLLPVVVLALVGLGLNFVIGGLWGAAALGAFNQVTSAYFVLAALGAVCINFSVVRAVARAPDDRARLGAIAVGGLVPAVMLAALVSALFLGARTTVARLLGSDAVAVGICWAAPGLFCFIVNKVLLGIANGLSRMRAYAAYTTLRYLMIAIGLALAWAFDLPAEALPGIWSFAEGILLIVLCVELAATVSFSDRAGWKRWAWQHLSYGLRGFAAVLLLEINSRLDIWMLGPVFSDATVGVYSMAGSMAEGASQLAVVLQVNLNPHMAAHLAAVQPAEIETLVRRTRRWFVPLMAAMLGIGAAVPRGHPVAHWQRRVRGRGGAVRVPHARPHPELAVAALQSNLAHGVAAGVAHALRKCRPVHERAGVLFPHPPLWSGWGCGSLGGSAARLVAAAQANGGRPPQGQVMRQCRFPP